MSKKAKEVVGVLEFNSIEEMADFHDMLLDLAEEIEGVLGVEYEEDGIGMSINLEDEIDKVTFNDPATIVFWKDGTKTISKCHKGDTYNKELGLAMCIIRKLCNNRNYNNVFEKFIK